MSVPKGQPYWGYTGNKTGPARWGGLSRDWAICSRGQFQSPIDIDESTPQDLPALSTAFKESSLRISHNAHMADVINTGHAVQISFPGGDTLKVGDETYELLQLHFHTPSEHTVMGKRYPMEVHYVHRNAAGGLAVLAVFVEEGAMHPGLGGVLVALPDQQGLQYSYENLKVDATRALPADRTTYRYEGSLTAPPCTEGVKYFVFKTPIQASFEQIDALSRLTKANNRPLQRRWGRPILTEKVAGQ